MISTQHLPAAKISVIHNSLVFPASSAAGRNDALRAQHGATPETTVLLNVAMFRPEKNQRELVQLVADLPATADWQLWLAGDGPARAEIEALMAPFGSRVRFAGAVPHGELPSLYATADLYLWPAINEAYGMAFLEAQAAGLPVVAGRTGGVPAVVADTVTGLLTPIGDAASFAAAVSRLLDSADERARLGAAAAARVASRHDERAAAQALAAALARLRELPPANYSEQQWAVLGAIVRLLPRATALLWTVFGAHGQCDFTEISQSAVRALGPDDAPSDLALALDYRIRHLLVDEFQDTNNAQFQLVHALTCELSGHGVDAGATHAYASTDRVYALVMRNHSDLGA